MLLYPFFIIPLIFSFLAVGTNKFPFKLGVTLSCIGIILFSRLPAGSGDDPFWLILIALLISISGDFFLSHREEEGKEKPGWFVYGTILFFFAHVFYLAYAAGDSRFPLILFLVLFAGLVLYSIFRLLPRLEELPLKVAITLYMVISCLSFSFAWGIRGAGAGRIFFILGIGLILFSDLCIAEAELIGFTPPGKLILPTYYAAHMALALGLSLS